MQDHVFPGLTMSITPILFMSISSLGTRLVCSQHPVPIGIYYAEGCGSWGHVVLEEGSLTEGEKLVVENPSSTAYCTLSRMTLASSVRTLLRMTLRYHWAETGCVWSSCIQSSLRGPILSECFDLCEVTGNSSENMLIFVNFEWNVWITRGSIKVPNEVNALLTFNVLW